MTQAPTPPPGFFQQLQATAPPMTPTQAAGGLTSEEWAHVEATWPEPQKQQLKAVANMPEGDVRTFYNMVAPTMPSPAPALPTTTQLGPGPAPALPSTQPGAGPFPVSPTPTAEAPAEEKPKGKGKGKGQRATSTESKKLALLNSCAQGGLDSQQAMQYLALAGLN